MYDWDCIIKQNPSIDELIYITNSVLVEWTNRSLCNHGYDIEMLRSYDSFFGKMLKWAEREIKIADSKYIYFINMWNCL